MSLPSDENRLLEPAAVHRAVEPQALQNVPRIRRLIVAEEPGCAMLDGRSVETGSAAAFTGKPFALIAVQLAVRGSGPVQPSRSIGSNRRCPAK